MGTKDSFEVKNIEIWALAFFKHNNSSVATVSLVAATFGSSKKILLCITEFRVDQVYYPDLILS